MLNDTSAETLVYIKNMVNSAYKSLLSFLPTYWTEKSGTVSITYSSSGVVDLPADCFKIIHVDYPSGSLLTHKPVIVTQEDWECFRVPPDATDCPLIFYAGGYRTSGSTNYLQLHFYPACSTTYAGLYRIRYYSLPNDMTADTDLPVFDDRWQHLLLSRCQVELLHYQGKHVEAQTLDSVTQPQLQAYLARESKAEMKG